MNASSNPFQYEAANNLPVETIIDVYVEDFNFSRFIQSKRNIFLVGERGSGKTMTLLYNSLPVQLAKHEKEGRGRPLDMIGVYIPCNTPLTHRKEYQLLPDSNASGGSDQFLVVAVIDNIAETLSLVPETLDGVDQVKLRSEIEYLLGFQLREAEGFFKDLRDWAQREIIATQRKINDQSSDAYYEDCLSFASGVMPLLGVIRRIPLLKDSHFLLMMDDAHDLNEHQSRSRS